MIHRQTFLRSDEAKTLGLEEAKVLSKEEFAPTGAWAYVNPESIGCIMVMVSVAVTPSAEVTQQPTRSRVLFATACLHQAVFQAGPPPRGDAQRVLPAAGESIPWELSAGGDGTLLRCGRLIAPFISVSFAGSAGVHSRQAGTCRHEVQHLVPEGAKRAPRPRQGAVPGAHLSAALSGHHRGAGDPDSELEEVGVSGK